MKCDRERIEYIFQKKEEEIYRFQSKNKLYTLKNVQLKIRPTLIFRKEKTYSMFQQKSHTNSS